MKKRHNTEIFSLSFLDIITCGFGAIILLLIISKTAVSTTTIESIIKPNDSMLIRDLQHRLFNIRNETRNLNRKLDAKQKKLSILAAHIAHLRQSRNKAETQLNNLKEKASIQSSISKQFETAKQSLTEEMRRLLSKLQYSDSNLVGGIPVDSEYIIFVIDTSGSMLKVNWEKMIDQLNITLNTYPNVKGLQVMSDMGDYLFSQYRGKWIPDTPGRRKIIIKNLRIWNTFSNSSPVEGITKAIRTFYDPLKKISIYVFGDEFTGNSISDTIDMINKLNPEDNNGNKKIRIHGVGFPIPDDSPEYYHITNQRFATLMRELGQKNGGTFIGLN